MLKPQEGIHDAWPNHHDPRCLEINFTLFQASGSRAVEDHAGIRLLKDMDVALRTGFALKKPDKRQAQVWKHCEAGAGLRSFAALALKRTRKRKDPCLGRTKDRGMHAHPDAPNTEKLFVCLFHTPISRRRKPSGQNLWRVAPRPCLQSGPHARALKRELKWVLFLIFRANIYTRTAKFTTDTQNRQQAPNLK